MMLQGRVHTQVRTRMVVQLTEWEVVMIASKVLMYQDQALMIAHSIQSRREHSVARLVVQLDVDQVVIVTLQDLDLTITRMGQKVEPGGVKRHVVKETSTMLLDPGSTHHLTI